MALGDPAPIITPRAEDFAPQAQPIVNPQSTAALTSAFRSGFITADDIIERVGARAQQKKKLESLQTQQQISDLENTEMQEARLITARAAKARGLQSIREAEEAEKLAPLKQQAERAKTQRAILDDTSLGLSEKIATVLPINGFTVPKTSDGQVDVEAGTQILNDIMQFDTLKKRAEATAAAIKEVPLTTGTGAVYRTFENLLDENMSSDEARKQLQNARQILASNYQDWSARNKPTRVNMWGQPGQVAQPAAAPAAAPAVAPEVTPEQRAAVANQLGPTGPKQVSQMTNTQIAQQQPSVAPAPATAAAPGPQITPLGQYNPTIGGRLITEGKPSTEKFTQENTMAQQLSQRSEVKAASAARSALAPVQSILANIQPNGDFAPGVQDKRQQDFALILAYAKAVDPESVAREGEVKLVTKSTAFADTYLKDLGDAANVIFGNQEFSAISRKVMKERLQNAISARNEEGRRVTADFANDALNRQLDPSLVAGPDRYADLLQSGWKPGQPYVPSFQRSVQGASGSAAAPATGGQVFRTPDGQRVQQLPDGRFQIVK